MRGVIIINIGKRIKKLYDRLHNSLKRFPIALVYAALTVGTLIYMNHLGYKNQDGMDLYGRIAMVLAMGVPISLSLYVFFERKKDIKSFIKVLSHLAAAIILMMFYFLFLKQIDYVSGTRYVSLSIALYIIFTFIPYINRKENYEIYVIRLFCRFVVTYLYSVVLYLGLAATLLTINLLFDAGISGRVFADIGFTVAGIFAPAFFLADVPSKNEEMSNVDYPKVLRVLLQFIVLPLLLVYTIILYVYFGKSIITMELPQGLIGNLVLWYSIISTIVLFFIYPLRKFNKWIKTFLDIFPKVIIPLLGMMFVSIVIRINAYGITEDRYFVVIIGLWITFVMIYYSIKKDIRNIIVTITLAIIAIISVIGPISSYSISKWSQNGRLEEVLESYNMIDKSGYIKSTATDQEVSEEDQMEISSIIQYFDRYHDLDDIKYFSEDFRTSDMDEVFGFRLINEGIISRGNLEYFNYNLDNRELIIDIEDFDYFSEHRVFPDYNNQNKKEDIIITFKDKEIIIKNNDEEIYTKNLEKIVEGIREENVESKNLTQNEMTYTEETEDIKIEILFRNINGHQNRSNDETTVERMEFYTFVKLK